MSLLLHRSAHEVSYEQLKEIPTPESTPSFKPVGHFDLITLLANAAERMLPDYQLQSSQFGVTRN